MRTRNAGTPKTPAAQKKTTATKKAASKAPSSATAAVVDTPPQSIDESTPTSSSLATPLTELETTPASESAGEQVTPSTEDATVDPPAKGKKKVTRTRKVIRKVMRPKTPASAESTVEVAEAMVEAVSVDVAKDATGDQEVKDDEMTDVKVEQSLEAEVVLKAIESKAQEEIETQKPEDLAVVEEKGKAKMDVDDSVSAETEAPSVEGASKSVAEPSESIEEHIEEPVEEPVEEVNAAAETLDTVKEPEDQPDDVDDLPDDMDDDQKVENTENVQKLENTDDVQKPENTDDVQKPENMDADHKEEAEAEQLKEDDPPVSEGIEDYGDEEGFVEPGDEDLRDDDEPETTDETKALDEEHKELAAAAKARKTKKEHEIFVGGLDSEVSEEDVKKTFEKAGEVVEVRLLKDPTTNKNRGFAFVRFFSKDQAKKALSEMKNPVICGKRCGTAPNEDNDTLFVGNICNTWTKEAIKQKLKDYDVEGIESITLVQDPRQEGLSRGFCFIQFDCHADAMSAYKRLQKPDAVFGHAERTAKVAFAEPLQEPDPEVMAKVKSVFIDGVPPFWDEDHVKRHFKSYGEIERVTLARNMSTAKRKDFGFVDYTTHEAAVSCIEDVNKKELADGNLKVKVRARLSNPMPKMQAVKGGMCGGFRIGRPTGRSLGRPAPSVSRPNFQYNRVSRGSFNNPVGPYGRRGLHRGGHIAPGVNAPGRPSFNAPRHAFIDRGPVRPVPPPREQFPLYDGGYSRSFVGRHYDDPYAYGDSHGLKRPFYMTEPDPGYMAPSQVRPRFDYTASGRGSHFRDTFGAGSSLYPSSYYPADYNARPHSSYNSRDHAYAAGSGSGGGASGGRGRGSGRGSSRGSGRGGGRGGASGYYY